MTVHRAAALLLWVILCGCDDDKISPGSLTGGAPYASGHELTVSSSDPAALQVENEIIQLTNEHRLSIGLQALSADDQAAAVARGHSRHMLVHGFFSHTNPEGDGPGERLSRAGVFWLSYGENIAAGYPSAQEAFQAWLSSPGHRANIEGSGWTHVGVGYWEGYYTQVFLRRP